MSYRQKGAVISTLHYSERLKQSEERGLILLSYGFTLFLGGEKLYLRLCFKQCDTELRGLLCLNHLVQIGTASWLIFIT